MAINGNRETNDAFEGGCLRTELMDYSGLKNS